MATPEIQTRISLHVSPNAAKNEVVGFTDGVWRVRVAAPPVKGEANRELIDFLSKRLDVSKNSLSLIKGHASRNKVVGVKELSEAEVTLRLRGN